MKKFIAIIVALFCFATVSFAQPKAIGVRGTFGAELSYQHYVGGANFLEFDLGLFNHFLSSAVVYDFNLVNLGENASIYGGPGAFFSIHPDGSYIYAGLVGQIGIQYNFPTIPLQISLDWRPQFDFVHGFYGQYNGAGLGIRYRF